MSDASKKLLGPAAVAVAGDDGLQETVRGACRNQWERLAGNSGRGLQEESRGACRTRRRWCADRREACRKVAPVVQGRCETLHA